MVFAIIMVVVCIALAGVCIRRAIKAKGSRDAVAMAICALIVGYLAATLIAGLIMHQVNQAGFS